MKKFILSALIGASSAYDSFLAHDLEDYEIDTSALTGDMFSTTIGTGVCQAMSGYDLYNLKSWDGLGEDRSVTDSTPAAINVTSGNTFLYKSCQPTWDMKEKLISNTSGATLDKTCKDMDGVAYMVDPSTGKCLYSFENSEFTGIVDSDSEANLTKGFDLAFESKEACVGDSTKNFTVTFKAYCMKKDVAKSSGKLRVTGYDSTLMGKFVLGADGTCHQNIDYYGSEACKLYTIELKAALDFVAKFAGVFFIVGGLVLCFYGAKIILYALFAIVFMGVTAVVFGGVYNFILPVTTGIPVLVVVFVVSLILGGVAAYFMKKFFDKYGVPILTAAGGIILALELVGLVTTNGIAQIAAMVVGALLGGFLGKKLNKLAKCMTTSLIGAYFTVKGVKCYTVGLSDTTVNGTKVAPWAELGGVVGLTIGGTLLKLYLLRNETSDGEDKYDNFMANEDEGRTCGCF